MQHIPKKAKISRWPGRSHFVVTFTRDEDYNKKFLDLEEAINFALTKVKKENIIVNENIKIPRTHQGD